MIYAVPAPNRELSKCYIGYTGNEKFVLKMDDRQSSSASSSVSFSVLKKKRVTVNIDDNYRAFYENLAYETNLLMEVTLSSRKNYRDLILTHLQNISDHHTEDHKETMSVEHFKIDSFSVFGFTGSNLTNRLIGNYYVFPSEKISVHFSFVPQLGSKLKTIEEFIAVRDSTIKSYLVYLKGCEN